MAYKIKNSRTKEKVTYKEGLDMLNLQIRNAENDEELVELYNLRTKWIKKYKK